MRVDAMKHALFVFAAVVALVLVSGCTQTTPSVNDQNSSPYGNGPQTHSVSINNFAFSPNSLTINAGDTVVWTNNQGVPHTITSDSGSELASSQIQSGQTYSHTFSTPGTFNYHCSIHTTMKASITVV